MQFMDDAIWALLEKGIVSPHEAFMKAIDKSRFKPFLSAEEEALANAAGGIRDEERRPPGNLLRPVGARAAGASALSVANTRRDSTILPCAWTRALKAARRTVTCSVRCPQRIRRARLDASTGHLSFGNCQHCGRAEFAGTE